MTPETAQAWLNEIENMLEQRQLLNGSQEEELKANLETALRLHTRALIEARRLKVVEGRVVGP